MTNSLLTSVGELSISLWDIHVLCGLPISGDIYDGHIPSASELIGTDVDPKSTPRCCQTLNLGIHVLASIYNGLNAISESSTPGQADSHFPIHYVYRWLLFYFDTHFANNHAFASPLMITYFGEGAWCKSLILLIDLADSLATIKMVALAYWARKNVESHLRRSSPKSRSSLDEPQKDHRNRPEVSIFDGKDLVLEEFKMGVINVWNKLRGKLDDTPIEHIFSLQESFNNAFANLRKLDLDISPLEARVEEVFKTAHELDELRSTISEKTSSESQGLAQECSRRGHTT
nr:uncharacterized protein LOC107762125 [Ipomoea trifida]